MEEFLKIYKKFYNRIALEAILKSLLIGTAISSGIGIVISLVLYLVGLNMIWIAVVVFLLADIITTVLFYLLRYRPTEEDVARRVDLEGLKERLITMVQNKDSDSLIARLQREDAIANAERIKNTKLKLILSKKAIIASGILFPITLACFITFGIGLNGGFPSFDDIITPEPEIEYVNVAYFENEGGYIDGEMYQILAKGSSSSEVLAVADDGYMFEIWSDGVVTPNRMETDVQESIEVFAIFVEINEIEDPSDRVDPNLPSDDDMGSIDGDGLPPHGAGAAGKYEEYNQVIDGNTYYRDVYKKYYDEAIKILNAGGEIPAYMREIIEQYFGVIK